MSPHSSEPAGVPQESGSRLLKSVVLLAPQKAYELYGPEVLAQIAQISELHDALSPEQALREPARLAETEVIFTGWSAPKFDHALLAFMPKLRAIFYAGGSVKPWATDAVWDRGLVVVSAYAANAIPVAEYTVGAILFSLKRGWHYVAQQHREKRYPSPLVDAPGGMGSSVGIVSLGTVGRLVCDRLRAFELKLLAYDPFVSAQQARELGVTLVSLNELFELCDVVSVHAPILPATEGLIGREQLQRLRANATLINTARGAVLREDDLVEALSQRSDLTAVLDVLVDEPPPTDHPLIGLANVVITPHIAGAIGLECRRLGQLVVEEFQGWRGGQPLRWQITREKAQFLA